MGILAGVLSQKGQAQRSVGTHAVDSRAASTCHPLPLTQQPCDLGVRPYSPLSSNFVLHVGRGCLPDNHCQNSELKLSTLFKISETKQFILTSKIRHSAGEHWIPPRPRSGSRAQGLLTMPRGPHSPDLLWVTSNASHAHLLSQAGMCFLPPELLSKNYF